MKHERVNYIAVGAFVLLAIGTLFWAIFQLTGRSGPTDHYYVYYGDVTGIRYGTPVYFQGYPLGQVNEVVPVPGENGNGIRYKVQLEVQADWPIPADSVARVKASGLLAVITIEIEQGIAEELKEPGSELIGLEGGDIMATMDETAAEMRMLAKHTVKPMLERMEKQLVSIGGTLDTGVNTLMVDAKTVMTEAKEVMAEAKTLSVTLNKDALLVQDVLNEENRKHISEGLKRANQAAADASAMAQELRTVAENAGKVLSDDNRVKIETILQSMVNTAGQVESASGDLAKTRQHLDAALIQVDQSMGVISGTLSENRPAIQASMQDLQTTLRAVSGRIDAITMQVDMATRNLSTFSRQIRRDPSILLRGEGGR